MHLTNSYAILQGVQTAHPTRLALGITIPVDGKGLHLPAATAELVMAYIEVSRTGGELGLPAHTMVVMADYLVRSR